MCTSWCASKVYAILRVNILKHPMLPHFCRSRRWQTRTHMFLGTLRIFESHHISPKWFGPDKSRNRTSSVVCPLVQHHKIIQNPCALNCTLEPSSRHSGALLSWANRGVKPISGLATRISRDGNWWIWDINASSADSTWFNCDKAACHRFLTWTDLNSIGVWCACLLTNDQERLLQKCKTESTETYWNQAKFPKQ